MSYGGASPNGIGSYPFNSNATYNCDPGFSLVGSNDTRTCTGDGSSISGAFDRVALTCERELQFCSITLANYVFAIAIMCPFLTTPVNGSVTYTSTSNGNSSYPFNSMAIFSCNTGFSLVGGNNRTCTGDGSSTTGTFNGVNPICEGTRIYIQ